MESTADSPQDTVIVSDENLAPIAYAGQDLVGVENQQVTLDASASLDFDGDALTYFLRLWILMAMPSLICGASPASRLEAAQTVNVQDVVTLNGQASYDANGDTLSFQWSMTTAPSGSTSTLASTDQSSTSFTPDVAGLYVVQLVVDDGSQSSLPSMISITANAPTAITTTSLPAGRP